MEEDFRLFLGGISTTGTRRLDDEENDGGAGVREELGLEREEEEDVWAMECVRASCIDQVMTAPHRSFSLSSR